MKTRFGIFLFSMLSLTIWMATDLAPDALAIPPGPPEGQCAELHQACRTDADCCDAENVCSGGVCDTLL